MVEATNPGAHAAASTLPADRLPDVEGPVKMRTRDLKLWYGGKQALAGINLDIPQHQVTAFIGPSGCGKTTFLKCLNRMNDTVEGVTIRGHASLDGADIYDRSVDVVQLRARVGMVFQKPNPFPKSIYDNVAYGPRIHGLADNRRDLDGIVESSLRRAGLWEEVSGRPRRTGDRNVRRPAAAPVHRAHDRREPGSDPDGRTLLGPRPDLHGAHRGTDRRVEGQLHDRHRDPQPAAGGRASPS